MYPSFKAIHKRCPMAFVDYDPGTLCQDDYEYFSGEGQYSDDFFEDIAILEKDRKIEEDEIRYGGCN